MSSRSSIRRNYRSVFRALYPRLETLVHVLKTQAIKADGREGKFWQGGIMKILGISCSSRKEMATHKALEHCLNAARREHSEIDTDILDLADFVVHGCRACGLCQDSLQCSIRDEFRNLIPILADEDVKGMIVGTPVYLGSMAAQCKAFLDRTVMFRRNGFIFRDRVGGALAVGGVRNGGQEIAIQAIQAAMLCHDMIVVSDGVDTAHFGGTVWSGAEGDVEKDAVGLETAANLGRRVADVVCKMHAGNR